MKTMLMFVTLLLIPVFAHAAEYSKTPADTEMITVAKAADLLTALNAIGGNHDVIVGQGASQRAIPQPYDLSTDTRWAITDNITALRKVIITAQELVKQQTAAAEAKNGGPLKEDSVEKKKLDAEAQKIVDSERPVNKLFRIKRADLKLNVNAIPTAILSSLDTIIDP